MNNIAQNTIWFILLVLMQVLIFNNINLFGYTNPYIYIAYIFFYPVKKEKGTFLVLSFLLGLCIDFFSDTGGINAASTLFIAFIRLSVLSSILNKNDYDYQLFNIRSISFGKAITFISVLTFTHHLLLFTLDFFSLKDIGSILSKTLTTSLISIILIIVGIILFTKKK